MHKQNPNLVAPNQISLDLNIDKDMVNSPAHYAAGRLEQEGLGESIETLDYIYDKLTPEEFRGYIKGNVLKYISRENRKNGDEDMHKVVFYLNYLLYHKKTDGSKELK